MIDKVDREMRQFTDTFERSATTEVVSDKELRLNKVNREQTPQAKVTIFLYMASLSGS
jgi:hypothetical protein